MPRVVLTRWVFTAVMATGVGIGLGMLGGEAWAQPEPPREAEPAAKCKVDLRLTGTMADVVSNVLLRVMKRPQAGVRTFLKEAKDKYVNGQDLMEAAAKHFGIDAATMAQEVERMRHTNCDHPFGSEFYGRKDERLGELRPSVEYGVSITPFARDVATHVVLHEIAHALVREFDLPVLANEETMADAFATHYLIHHMPERAAAVIAARVKSLMVEAKEVPREKWPVNGEHNNDARRAFQIAALAVAADEKKFAALIGIAEMTAADVRKAKDYGADMHRAWRRTLEPLMMPEGKPSDEAGVECEEGCFTDASGAELIAEMERALTRFDWHSQVMVKFVPDDGGASWNRSRRTVTVNSAYLKRFVEQGEKIEAMKGTP